MRNFFWVIGLIFVSTISCVKDTPVLFDVRLNTRIDIPAGLGTLETHYFTIRNVPTFFAQSANNVSVDPKEVSSIQSAKGLIMSTFSSEDLSFIDRISIYVISKTDPTKKREMYYLDFVPFNTNEEIRMLSATSELKDILSDETVDLEVRLNLREFNPRSISCTIDFGYSVL
jgi:hypothetical protein